MRDSSANYLRARKVRRNPPGKVRAFLGRYVRALLGTDEPTGIVAGIAREYMYVIMADGLSRGNAAVLEDIQSCRIECVRYGTRDPLCVTHDSRELLWGQVEDRWCMPLQDHQNMTRAEWPWSDECQRLGLIINDRPVVSPSESLAERARVMCGRLNRHGGDGITARIREP